LCRAVAPSTPTNAIADIPPLKVQSSIVLNVVNDVNSANKDVHFKGCPPNYMGGCQFVYSGASGSGFGFQPNGNNQYGAWTTTITGVASGLMKATFVIPSGVISINITTFLSVDARTGAVVDYTDGAKFSFGSLPAGLTWTSESGVFLKSTPAGSADADGDGTPDVSDGCPNDAHKTSPGTCGCGVPDVDTDSDGKCDGVDNCPSVANPDQADADADGVGDACDKCPSVANADQADGDGDGTARLGEEHGGLTR